MEIFMFQCQVLSQGMDFTSIARGGVPVLSMDRVNQESVIKDCVNFLRSGCPLVQVISETNLDGISARAASLELALKKLEVSRESFCVTQLERPKKKTEFRKGDYQRWIARMTAINEDEREDRIRMITVQRIIKQ